MKLREVLIGLITILVLVLVVDPTDLIFHLKTPLFLVILLVFLSTKFTQTISLNRDVVLIIFTFISIPMWGISVSLIQGTFVDMEIAAGFLKSFFLIILLYIVFDQQIKLDLILIKVTILIPLIIIPTYLILLYDQSVYFIIYDYLSVEKKVAMFSLRSYFGQTFMMLYYKTSPLLVFPLSYYWDKFLASKKSIFFFILAAIFAFTLFVSGTRANVVAAIIVLGYHMYDRIKSQTMRIFMSSVLAISVFFGVFLLLQISVSTGEESAEVKAGHFSSYVTLFEEKPQYLIWGQGLGSSFYSSGAGQYLSQSELTYFDLIRLFGIPIFSLLLFLIVYPLIILMLNKKITSKNKYTLVAYLSYLFIAGTNPLLISSTGILVIIVMYSLIKHERVRI
ncbi:hypothetical protein [Pedobacter sp.]